MGVRKSPWTVAELGKFYSDNRGSLVSHASRLLGNVSFSEEIVQDATIKVLIAAPELESQAHANAYIRKTIENLCIDHLRREGKRPQLVLVEQSISDYEVNLQDNRDLSEVISSAEDAAIVRQALSLLSPAERAALVMWEVEGRSTRDIARELGVKESAVRHTISRARASLRKILSNYIIDESSGLTALDLLSRSYQRASKLAQKSSRVALSALLLVVAFLSLENLQDQSNLSQTTIQSGVSSKNSHIDSSLLQKESQKEPAARSPLQPSSRKATLPASNAKATQIRFPGLDKDGVPIGFTVTDSSGGMGLLYFSGKEATASDESLTLSSIAKTSSGAANILVTQTVTQNTTGVFFDAMLAFGRLDNWIPLSTKIISTDIERLPSGNYLLTANIQVKSEVSSIVAVPATAGGRDLEVAPVRVLIRMTLDSAKSRVLAEAIQVIEKVS